nr:ATPase subunit 6 [Myrmedobia distinguenda]
MMTNLFSTFDPATHMNMSLNWTSSILSLISIPYMYWILPSRYNKIMEAIIMKLYNELSPLSNFKSKGISLIMISMFFFITFNNMMGLLPYVFTSSSHIVFSLTLALPMWLTFMLFGWINNSNNMFAHMIPLGTPPILMPFMICIETISNLIRPCSLAIRLTANMIAGHLLMSLLGDNNLGANSIIVPLIMVIQMVLMLFEVAVSLIQAYVFTTLSTLYSSEVI